MRLLLSLLISTNLFAQTDTLRYEISFQNASHHEAEVSLIIPAAYTEEILQARMSRSSPGRYAIHEFAKNVYKVSAKAKNNRDLEITRPDPYQWDIAGGKGEVVKLKYTLFADRAGGTYSGIDLSHAHLNMPATFMWIKGLEDVPISIKFKPIDPKWKVATQLFPTGETYLFTAPNFQYFMDSPTELSDFSMRTWTVEDQNDGVQIIRLAVHHDGTEAEVDAYAEMAKKVVQAQIDIYGGDIPTYDGGTYTFIADYLPHVSGDGMEHRNSTIIASQRPLKTGAMRNLGTLSHEYFHQWNVERIRPSSLEPFDFTKANMSSELWFAEGFTSYYTGLAIRRAGLTSDQEYAASLSNTISTVVNSPGRRFFSAVEMSQRAPFRDASSSIDPTNFNNTFISYYTWGSAIALGLDLSLRKDFQLDLDAFMRSMWKKYQADESSYSVDDIEETLAAFTADSIFAKDFFDRFIRGHEVPDYKTLLDHFGLKLEPMNPENIWLGSEISIEDETMIVEDYPLMGSSLYKADIDKGDQILSVNGIPIKNVDVFKLRVDQNVSIEFIQRGKKRKTNVRMVRDPSLQVVIDESANQEMLSKRRQWLEGK